jgi:hypothetical protein
MVRLIERLAAQLHAEAGAARLRPGSLAASVAASAVASRRLQFATRFRERHRRQPPRRFGFGTWALAAQLSVCAVRPAEAFVPGGSKRRHMCRLEGNRT